LRAGQQSHDKPETVHDFVKTRAGRLKGQLDNERGSATSFSDEHAGHRVLAAKFPGASRRACQALSTRILGASKNCGMSRICAAAVDRVFLNKFRKAAGPSEVENGVGLAPVAV